KMKKASLFSALTAKMQQKQIKIITGLEKLPLKTKEMASVLKKLDLNTGKQHVLLVLPKEQEKSRDIMRIARNIEGVEYISAGQLNTYEVLHNSVLLFVKDAITSLENHYMRKEEK